MTLLHLSFAVSVCLSYSSRLGKTHLLFFSYFCVPTRTLRSKKQQSSSGSLSLFLSQEATPRKTLSFSAVNTPVNSIVQESNTGFDASPLISNQDQSNLRQRTLTTTTTTCVDGHQGEFWKQ